MLRGMRHGLHGRSLVGLLLAAALCLLAVAGPAAAAGLAPDHSFPAPAVDAPEATSAIAPNGYAIVAWVETLSAGQSRVDVALHPPGGDWSAPQPLGLSSDTLSGVQVAIDANGAAAVAWDGSSSGLLAASAATRPAGGSFGAAENFGNGRGARVGIDASGRVTLLYGVTSAEIVQSAPAGSSLLFAPVTTLSSTCGTFDASLAVAPSGDAIAGFQCSGDVSFAVRTAGSWSATSTPFTHTTAPACTAPGVGGGTSTFYSDVHVAIDAQGHVGGVVQRRDSTDPCITFPSFFFIDTDSIMLALPGGGTMVAGPTVAASTAGGFPFIPGDVHFPSIGIGGGDVVVGWQQGDPSGVNYQPATRTYPSNGAGTPGAPQLLSSPTVALGDGRIAVGPQGQVLDTWAEEPSGGTHLIVYAAYQAAGAASFGAPLQVSDGTTDAANISGAFADSGDGVVSYRDARGGAHIVHARGFDVTPPSFTAFASPASATAGVPASFSAGATDLWGPVSFAWSFGDGSASGASVSHAFAAAGAHSITITATDGAGNATSRSASLNVLAAAIPVPVLSKLSETHRRFRVGRTRTAVSAARRKRRAPIGTTFRFTLNEAAVVRIRIERKLPGRVSGGRCVKPTRRLAHKRRCTRYVLVKTLIRRHLKAGANRVAFSGRIGRRALKPGGYRAIFTPSAGTRKGRAHRLRFTIVR